MQPHDDARPLPPGWAEEGSELEALRELLPRAWGLGSAFDKRAWDEANPAAGQCVPTALVVRQLFGGYVLYTDVEDRGQTVRHYWNELESGREVDLTKVQFSGEAEFGETSRRYLPFGADSRRRAAALLARYNELRVERDDTD